MSKHRLTHEIKDLRLDQMNKFLLIQVFPILKEAYPSTTYIVPRLDLITKEVYDDKTVSNNSWKRTMGKKVQCPKGERRCKSYSIYYNPSIKNLGSFTFRLKAIEALYDKGLDGFEIKVTTGCPKFVKFVSFLKNTYFFISFFFFIIFLLKLKKLSKEKWIIEQEMIKKISIMLILLNDPFYAIIMYKPTTIK